MDANFSCLLDHRGIIRLGGADRRVFLQGLISNDINLCSEGRAIYAALLTPQGKFLHDLFIIEDGDEFLIDCEADRAEDLLKRLAGYKLRAKVTVQDARGEFEVLGVRGWRLEAGEYKIFTDPRTPELGHRIILKKENPLASNLQPLASYDRHRLSLGIADGSRDMVIEKSTLAEGNFDFLNGISFTKGCYVGQELTARMHYRALVKKRMFPVVIEGDAPALGSPVTLNGEEIGDMRSHAGDLGLALLNVEKAEVAMQEKTALACSVSRLTVSKPEWMKKN